MDGLGQLTVDTTTVQALEVNSPSTLDCMVSSVKAGISDLVGINGGLDSLGLGAHGGFFAGYDASNDTSNDTSNDDQSIATRKSRRQSACYAEV